MIALAKDSRVQFDAEGHSYTLDGRRLPSVTQIISRVLPYQGPRDEWAMGRGTAMHHGCALSDAGKLDWTSVSPEIADRVRSWEKFRRDWPALVRATEQPMAHGRYGFAGTCDRVFNKDGRYVLAEIKSTIEPQVRLQLGAYSVLLADDCRIKISKAVAVELREDGYRTEWIERAELDRCERQFLAALTVFGFIETHKLSRQQ